MLSLEDLDCSDVISMFVLLGEAFEWVVAPLLSLASEVPMGGNSFATRRNITHVCAHTCVYEL